ncbi:MAG TPA: caspase family protein [Gemmataceae bacterium]|nr:caspase family protein [Gemmataceae bacterium]
MKTFIRLPKTMLIAAAVVALMTGATAQARAEGKTSDLHYVAVGVSKMPLMPQNHQLRYPHKDAKDLAKVWEAQKGKLYANVHGETLTDETAKLADILAALDRMVANAKTGDTAVVSLAGHGGKVAFLNNQWIFEPSDVDPRNATATLLTEKHLRDRLSQLTARSVTVILVLDTCQAGAFSTGDSGIVVLGGCTATQSSADHNTIANGYFTFALIEALNGKADANGDGEITLEEIQAFVAVRVPELTKLYAVTINGSRHEQTPVCFLPAGSLSGKPLTCGTVTVQMPGINMDRVR